MNVYLVTTELLSEFVVATFNDGYGEVAYGLGHFITTALRDAERQWNQAKDEDDDEDNPFTEALQYLGDKVIRFLFPSPLN